MKETVAASEGCCKARQSVIVKLTKDIQEINRTASFCASVHH